MNSLLWRCRYSLRVVSLVVDLRETPLSIRELQEALSHHDQNRQWSRGRHTQPKRLPARIEKEAEAGEDRKDEQTEQHWSDQLRERGSQLTEKSDAESGPETAPRGAVAGRGSGRCRGGGRRTHR